MREIWVHVNIPPASHVCIMTLLTLNNAILPPLPPEPKELYDRLVGVLYCFASEPLAFVLSFPLSIQNPKGFTIDLLEFLGSQAQYLHSLMALTASNIDTSKSSDRLGAVEQALEALRNVIKSNPGKTRKRRLHSGLKLYEIDAFIS